MSEKATRAVQVALPLPVTGTFTYSVPDEIPMPKPGARVRVHFGKKELMGFAVGDAGKDLPSKLRPIDLLLDIEPILPPDLVELGLWIADYYQVSLGLVLRCTYPSGLNPVSKKIFQLTDAGLAATDAEMAVIRGAFGTRGETGTGQKREGEAGRAPYSALRAALGAGAESAIGRAMSRGFLLQEESWDEAKWRTGGDRIYPLKRSDELGAAANSPDTPKTWKKALKLLIDNMEKGFLTVEDASREARVPQKVFSQMEQAGFIELFSLIPANLAGSISPHILNPGQELCVSQVSDAMKARDSSVFLLFGVTGSGKTEVYMRLIQEAMDAGGTAIYMVPEISMTSFLARRLLERFGAKLAILHSSMGDHERVRQWKRCASGEAKVAIGPRSALFSPLPGLGLILVDEEHDGAYRQQEHPRFSARDMAVVRGRICGAPVVLGSATPSVESYFNATEAAKYSLLTLPERAGGSELPSFEVVDMRVEFAEIKARSVISRSLEAAIGETFESGGQSVILRNRLGYSTFILCRSCGRTLQCQDCAVSLTFHMKGGFAKCHYCARQAPTPKVCPACGADAIQFLGEGTEKVEDLIAEKFPAARVERMDRERVRSGKDYDRLWRDFERGAIDILIGTQMIAKGHDVANVTLVGILSADFLLGMPDFRSAERTFQLLTQAAGRAGRGGKAGRVILQTFHPDHYAVEAACKHDFLEFYEKDIRYRKLVGYPPTSAIARIEARHASAQKADALADGAALFFAPLASPSFKVLGPVEAPIPRLEGSYRRQIILKAASRSRLRESVAEFFLSPFGKKHLHKDLDIEIDPATLL